MSRKHRPSDEAKAASSSQPIKPSSRAQYKDPSSSFPSPSSSSASSSSSGPSSTTSPPPDAAHSSWLYGGSPSPSSVRPMPSESLSPTSTARRETFLRRISRPYLRNNPHLHPSMFFPSSASSSGSSQSQSSSQQQTAGGVASKQPHQHHQHHHHPNLSNASLANQFGAEARMRPWQRGVQLFTLFSMAVATGYMSLFSDFGEQDHVFRPLRRYLGLDERGRVSQKAKDEHWEGKELGLPRPQPVGGSSNSNSNDSSKSIGGKEGGGGQDLSGDFEPLSMLSREQWEEQKARLEKKESRHQSDRPTSSSPSSPSSREHKRERQEIFNSLREAGLPIPSGSTQSGVTVQAQAQAQNGSLFPLSAQKQGQRGTIFARKDVRSPR